MALIIKTYIIYIKETASRKTGGFFCVLGKNKLLYNATDNLTGKSIYFTKYTKRLVQFVLVI